MIKNLGLNFHECDFNDNPEIQHSNSPIYFGKSIQNTDSTILFRTKRPFYIYGGLDGLGLGGTIFGFIDIQAGGLFLMHSEKIKIYLLGKNSAPFVGIGIGKQYNGFGGNGESNDWTVVFAGWQFFYFKDRGFLDLAFQYPVHESNRKAFQPTILTFSFGARIF